MYNKVTIIPGLIIFVLLVTFPLWFNAFSTASTVPKVELPPGGEKQCVAPAAEMRASHMQMLNEWRDDVLRNGNRTTVTVEGKVYRKGLQMACMECHTNKEKFCDSCHEYASVTPYCWDCHLTPSLAASKKETH
ncbi:sulfate reduction electron transfer complex DsrMKJOP subunit DsrJ [Desulforhopalus singaporensis]|uniref:Putative sulfite reductase-associated electron transfer protein DsrJ n=1 Tax=Desulforhopalus singaporensis TaxID=91360 RepID=A0A1H0NBB4_9BACT|nr:sulfate reduction electron transfer complex DsrMKJOP subunit DsrJ [Desulforhopalus singaporensis]SDO90044.1 putative sulfite reductase-associated electron transfer protein DsrJ [Desulforhopalus singaporensis]